MIHTRIKDRVAWLEELYKYIELDAPNEEVAKIIFRKLVFEE